VAVRRPNEYGIHKEYNMTNVIATFVLTTIFTLTNGEEYAHFGDTYQSYEQCMKQAEIQNKAMAEDIAACTGEACALKKAVADCVNTNDIEEVLDPQEIEWSVRQ
jgi:hypothetical protein